VRPKRNATDPSLLDTSPAWEITQNLVARERKIAHADPGADTTQSELPIVSELAAAEKKLARKPARRRKSH
jgi:hypothetical protein